MTSCTAELGGPEAAPYMTSLLSKFKIWLTSRGGLVATEAAANTTVGQVRRILQQVVQNCGGGYLKDSMLLMLGTLGDVGGILDQLERKFRLSVGTTANYAIAAGKFVSFLGHDWSLTKSWISKEDFIMLGKYVDRVKSTTGKSWRRVAPEDRPRTVGEDDLPEVNDVKNYFSSRSAREMVEVLNGNCRDFMACYGRMLSHILMEVWFSNAKRAGDIRHMQLGELAAAKKEADGRWSIRVKEHKVKSKACFVFVGSDVLSWLQKLTGMYCPPDVPAEVPYVFVTAQGSQY
jgi:hypothetical protein